MFVEGRDEQTLYGLGLQNGVAGLTSVYLKEVAEDRQIIAERDIQPDAPEVAGYCETVDSFQLAETAFYCHTRNIR